MDDVVSPFPLFNLPSNLQKNVIRNMKLIEQISYSTLSERAKNIVKSLNLRAIEFYAVIENSINMHVYLKDQIKLDSRFASNGNWNLSAQLDDIPRRFGKWGQYLVLDRGVLVENQRLDNLRFNIREWINHFQAIFHKPKIDKLTFHIRIDQYDIDSLRMTIQGLNIEKLSLSFKGSHNHADMIMETFENSKQLVIVGNPFRDIYKILMGNFTNLSLASPWKCTLDHLLVCNTSRFYIEFANISDKVLNLFLKHWTEGSNPRMSSMHIMFGENRRLDENVILKGLDHRVVQLKRKSDNIIRDGFVIQRKNNGTKAAIRLENARLSEFHFNVLK